MKWLGVTCRQFIPFEFIIVRVTVKQDATADGIAAEAQIINVDSSDSGPYFCQANNLYGRDQQLVQLQVQEPPQAPALLTAIMVTARSVNLKWQARAGDSAEVSKYIVEYMEYDGPWHEIELSNPPQYTALIENLKPATRYIFRVIAEGPAGQSVPSEELSVKTEPQRPAGAPLNLSARPLSSTEILVTWMPPLAELRHGEIQGYNIGYKTSTSSNSNNYNFTSISGDGDDGTGELMLTNLMKYTRYTIVIQAFNQVGSGPLSEPTTAQTLEDGLQFAELFFEGKINNFFPLFYQCSSKSSSRKYSMRTINITITSNIMAAAANASHKWPLARLQNKF